MVNAYIPSTWRRLAAHGVDQLFMMPFYFPFLSTAWRLFSSEDEVIVPLSSAIIYLLIPSIYEVVFLILMQRTPGKWIFDMKVVPAHDVDGKLHLTQCFMRPLAGLLSWFFGWALYATAFFRYDRTHLADWMAETRVVQALPRVKRPKIRWFLALFFILIISYDSLTTAKSVLQSVDWKNSKVDLRSLLDGASGSEIIRQYEEEVGEEYY